MTDEHKSQIKSMRDSGHSYKEISEKLGIPKSTIKTFCRRHETNMPPAEKAQDGICKQCSEPFDVPRYGRKKQFCSDTCRSAWGYRIENRKTSKTAVTLICAKCKKRFAGYGKRKQKYCSHKCYISDYHGR